MLGGTCLPRGKVQAPKAHRLAVRITLKNGLQQHLYVAPQGLDAFGKKAQVGTELAGQRADLNHGL